MGLKEILESNKIFLWICGVWPNEYQRKPKLSQIKLYFIWFNMLMMCLLSLAGLVSIATPETKPRFFTDLIGFAAAASKLIPFVFNRKKMMKLIFKTLKLEETLLVGNDNELEIVQSWRHIRYKFLKYHCWIYTVITVMYCGLPLLSPVKSYPVQTIIQANLFISPWYEFFYGFHSTELCFYLTIIVATDGFYVAFICKICEELQRFECLLSEKHERITLNGKSKNRHEILRFTIRKHCTILEYGEAIRNILTGAFFAQYFLLSATLCFASFTILSTTSAAMANQTSILAGACIAQLFMISLAGELISTRSLALANALLQSNFCCSNFEELTTSELRQIVLIQLRMQRPIKISIGIHGVINIEFFSQIMKTVYSFTMLLRSTYV